MAKKNNKIRNNQPIGGLFNKKQTKIARETSLAIFYVLFFCFITK